MIDDKFYAQDSASSDLKLLTELQFYDKKLITIVCHLFEEIYVFGSQKKFWLVNLQGKGGINCDKFALENDIKSIEFIRDT